jgi:hypothetical protein
MSDELKAVLKLIDLAILAETNPCTIVRYQQAVKILTSDLCAEFFIGGIPLSEF